MMTECPHATSRLTTLTRAASLSLGAAIALGMARFAYALLLPSMKVDLGWSFAQAGTMNTGNALGYLLGALSFPWLSRRWSTSGTFVIGCVGTTLLLALAGLAATSGALLALRIGSGVTSAFIFVGGGVLAARMASAHPRDAGIVLGLYYGGTGWGIMIAALLVPLTLRPGLHGWQPSWFALATACAVLTVITSRAARQVEADGLVIAPVKQLITTHRPDWLRFGFALAGYGLFGVGYIGYMTFVIALLRNAGLNANVATGFYVLLGTAVVVSAAPWASMLNRVRDGKALAILNSLVGIATLIPAFATQPYFAFISGALFGVTFLSVVASTTAFVRHNLPSDQWAAGISAFTIVFAVGQIVGPVIIGWVSDGAGLARGFVYSATLLFIGAVLAAVQQPLGTGA